MSATGMLIREVCGFAAPKGESKALTAESVSHLVSDSHGYLALPCRMRGTMNLGHNLAEALIWLYRVAAAANIDLDAAVAKYLGKYDPAESTGVLLQPDPNDLVKTYDGIHYTIYPKGGAK